MVNFLTDIGSTPWARVVSEYSDARGHFITGNLNYAESINGNGTDCSTSSCIITDTQIQAILFQEYSQLFPHSCPTTTPYFLFYAGKGYTVDGGGGVYSCVIFCAYHGAIATGNPECPIIIYSVFPYLGTDGPCGVGCGTSNPINNMHSVMSHEIAESITDPEVSFSGVGYGPPLAWYDDIYGEIADICGQVTAQTTARNSKIYTVQKLWSNQKQKCTATPYFDWPHLSPRITPPTCSCKTYIADTTG